MAEEEQQKAETPKAEQQQVALSPESSAKLRTDVPPGDLQETVLRVRTPVYTTAPSSPANLPSPRRRSIGALAGFVDGSKLAGLQNTDLAMSPDTTDRVFPIRSVVYKEPSSTAMSRTESGDSHAGTRNRESGDEGRRESSVRGFSHRRESSQPFRDASAGSFSFSRDPSQPTGASLRRRNTAELSPTDAQPSTANHAISSLLSDNESKPDSSVASVSSRQGSVSALPPDAHVTARFKHVVTVDGHAVVTGRDGETLQRCEDEPIHLPGAIQSFGLLIVLKEEDEKLVVRIVSENSAKIMGYTPAELFRVSSFLDLLTDDQADTFLDHLEFIREDDAADPANSGPEVFMLSIRVPGRRTVKFWCAMHINDTNKDIVICEFELEDDRINPLVPVGSDGPNTPADTLGSEPTVEELAESTINASRPLRVLRSARKKRGEAAAMEVFNVMAQIQEQLASASNLEKFLKILIGVIKELTGFHRVMIYQFDQSFNGRVVAELVDPAYTKDLYMGLNFPASDIPKQARDLYRLNKVRLLYDREQETARLVCRTVEDLENPLDMTYSYLRAMSPIHIKYLRNMAVRGSMSISITAFEELWGLISCHSYGSHGMRVSFPLRKMCRLVGETASRNIERLSYASRLQARKLINTAYSRDNPSGYIVASSDDLLELFSADCGALSIRDETKLLGRCEGHLQEVLALVEYLRLSQLNSVFTSTDVVLDFKDLRYAPGFKFIAGLLFVPLSNSKTDFIVFFRKGHLKEVKWAGNPYEKFIQAGTEGYLEPRKSFKTWSEVVIGKARDWTEEEVETAAVLCLVYGKFIEVWRQKEAAIENSQLQRLLLANSAHEFRTPLNAIINYLEIAMEGTLDQDTRDNLAKSHSASKSLVYVMNDLLDLTKTEQGLELVKEEVFDFPTMLKEATEPFRGDAQRKSLDYQVTTDDTIPHELVGDPRRVRQILSNIIANAIQHTASGFIKVGVAEVASGAESGKIEVQFVVEDSGAGMSQQQVDALFRELEQVAQPLPGDPMDPEDDDSKALTEASSSLGLGLAVVARAIRNMNGQLRLKTEVGKGSRFTVQLLLGLTNPSAIAGTTSGPSPQMKQVAIEGQAGYSSGEEMTLVRRNSRKSVRPASLARASSIDSVKSFNSRKSKASGQSMNSAKSDVDRLIDDMQKPYLLADAGLHNERRRPDSSGKASVTGSTGEATTIVKRADSLPEKSSLAKVPGEAKVTDSRTPIKPLRMQSTTDDLEGIPQKAPRVAFQVPASANASPPNESAFSVLVAEDDPINSKIMKKRLEKLGHRAHLTVNGEECASTLEENSSSYDVVLMDIQVRCKLFTYAMLTSQMPIVDGFTSTKMIRSFEKTRGTACLSPRAAPNGRIPVFAVSASLFEKEMDKYMAMGFDGWILKPVDFKRLATLLKGIDEESCRHECLFQPGQWEKGGWFEKRPAGNCHKISAADTRPDAEIPALDGEAEMTESPVEKE